MGTEFRLDKWISMLTSYSRKEIKELVRNNQILLDGKPVRSADIKLAEGTSVSINGQVLGLEQYVYYMLNKPQGVLSASRDRHAQTVLDLLPQHLWRPGLFPAGRLDKDTEGFVLITNDGQFAHRILSPKNKIPKTYYAELDSPFAFAQVEAAFAAGMDLGDGESSSPAQLTLLEMQPVPKVELVIYEGLYHQVKRMFAHFRLEVIFLKRLKIGGLVLDQTLKTGECKILNQEDLLLVYAH